MSNALTLVAQNTAASEAEITEVISGMIVSAKNQHGAKATNAEIAIVAGVAAKYGLNPLVREMAAFVSGGKLQVVVMIDGWYKMVNSKPEFDGVEFEDHMTDGKLTAITCRMYLNTRSRPIAVTEYLAECQKTGKGDDVWKKWPSRMLRHKAYIQAARMAFGISEATDPDEADRIKQAEPAERDITPEKPAFSLESIESDMAECGDLETLKKVCTSIRQTLEASGIWEQHKQQIIDLNKKHKARIESYKSDVEDAEFEEVSEPEQQKAETKTMADVFKAAEGALEEDIPFGDDEEEF